LATILNLKILFLKLKSLFLYIFSKLDEVPNGNYKLKIHGLAGLLVDEEKTLQYNAKTHSTIIQTDKSMYKPGDKVQFRVLFMDSETKPLAITEGLSVYILDNMGNRIVQWKDVVTPQGVFKADLQLSSNPVLGVWQIIAELKGVVSAKLIIINFF
jgi:CD109 antigen